MGETLSLRIHPGGEATMATSVRTFGDYLRHFARSVDIVDEYTIDEVRDLVYAYVRDELEAVFFSLACEQMVDGRAGLRTVWSTENVAHATVIRTPSGSYSSQISVSFGERKPLWVVNPGQKTLRHSGEYVDLWSDVPDLPPYNAPINRDIRTSIIVPLVHWSRVLGVIYLESVSYLEITEAAKEELSLLAEAISILLELRQAHRAQIAGTRAALSDLRAILNTTRFPRLVKPQVFVAFSTRARRDAVTIIQQVLDEFSDALKVVQWNRIEESGSITLPLIEEIARSSFGICYFSGPASSSEKGFEDDPYVLFEAGMIHSLTNSPVAIPSAWIPVREERSPGGLFDFASERVLIVTRSHGGEIMEERFRADLRSRVKMLLRIPPDSRTAETR